MNTSKYTAGEPHSSGKAKSSKFKSAIIFIVILSAGWGLYKTMGGGAPEQQQMAGAPVSVAKVVQKNLTVWQEFSGRLEAVENVQIKPRISGTIDAIHFKDGDMVTVGQKLFTIDPKPFEAELRRAEAALNSAQNDARVAKIDLDRARELGPVDI